jgi:hypothetical protein
LQYLSGGIVPTVMKRLNIQKEKELVALKEMLWKNLTKVSNEMKKCDVKLIDEVDDDVDGI